MPVNKNIAKHLHLTERGQSWLAQFAPNDRANARRLLEALTLVSHNEFERKVEQLIRASADLVDGPVGLYASREIPATAATLTYFEFASAPPGSGGSINAVAAGSDLGSEARVAALIRSICRANPEKFLNHPDLEELRSQKVDALIFVDDIIGSGKRTYGFVEAFWRDRSIRSWWSRNNILFFGVAYSATAAGAKYVMRHKSGIKLRYQQMAPTLWQLPWTREAISSMKRMLETYGNQTGRANMGLGYKGSCALLVFEHGCPNNAPSVLWAERVVPTPWIALFPERSILSGEQSAFPPEIGRRDSITVLLAAGQNRIAGGWSPTTTRPLGEDLLMILALIGKRFRTMEALSYGTGLSFERCTDLLENGISLGLITTTLRLTDAGRAELTAIDSTAHVNELPERGSDEYYPQVLRTHVGS